MILLHWTLFFLISFKIPVGESFGKYMYNITQSVGINGNTLSVGEFSPSDCVSVKGSMSVKLFTDRAYID